jgi:CRISPR-associated protein Csm3
MAGQIKGGEMTMAAPDTYRKIQGKIDIKGCLECLTGLHIGASRENMEIGALDSPVVRDPITLEPYIPGSSLKGKLRALMEKAHFELHPNRDGGSGISRHECNDWEAGKNRNPNYDMDVAYPGAIHCPVCRLFGSTGPGAGGKNYQSRLKVRDLHLINREELEKFETGLYLTEWKFENSIDRVTSAANPRNIERVPRGAKFNLSMVYDVEDKDTFQADMENLELAIRLIHDDALGGHGSRGYGRVQILIDQMEARSLQFYRGEEDGAIQIGDLTSEGVDKLSKFFWPAGE